MIQTNIQANFLADGRRLHLHHGPIDLIIEAKGAGRDDSYNRAVNRFETVLVELVAELELLRRPCKPNRRFSGVIARAMQESVACFQPQFITPMAAVAGAVADEILAVMKRSPGIDKINVNNGGDTAFFLARGEMITAAIAAPFDARITLASTDKFRGIATSGWQGRSQSFGIADSVTVIAKNAALADAAATLIANAVDLPGSPAISRTPAREVFPDSDLGMRMVTTGVGVLTQREIDAALASGAVLAQQFLDDGLIGAAMLVLKHQTRQIGGKNMIVSNVDANLKELDHA